MRVVLFFSFIVSPIFEPLYLLAMLPALSNRTIYYRLVALWVLCEAMLGGIIHGLRIPVSGLFVGSCAVICISLIAYYVPTKGAILKATIIVAIFKMMLSPQAPPPAYIAVFFQGLMGEALFWNRRLYRLSCLLLAVIALLESSLQRIVVLTIVYGNDLWKAINEFINGLTQQKQLTNYSLLIGGAYVLLHIITGMFVGLWAGLLPKKIKEWNERHPEFRVIPGQPSEMMIPQQKRKRFLKKGLLFIWIALILLYVQSYYKIGAPLLPSLISLKIFIRSVIIVLSWYLIVSPLVRHVLNKWLEKRKTRSQQDIQEVLALLPATQQLLAQSWKLSGRSKGWRRMVLFGKVVLGNLSLNPGSSPDDGKRNNILIFTGPVQSGKTTSLLQWSEGRDDVFGILTPVVDGKRVFMDAKSRQQFQMELEYGEGDSSIMIGRFIFSKQAFNRAVHVLHDAIGKPGWLIIDEIGPLELRDEGFAEALRHLLKSKREGQQILLVVREGLVEKVREWFGIINSVVINDISDY